MTIGIGYWQRMLGVDLSNHTSRVETIDESLLRDFIGGAGLGAQIVRREIKEKIDPFDARNLVIFVTGPFQGPAVPGGAKLFVIRSILIRSRKCYTTKNVPKK
jgi:aldehyde:ferredoxin oxidoreductase